MKVRARKVSARMSEKELSCPSKKRRKDSSFWQRKKDVAAALITSSCRKRRIESASLCLVSPSRLRVGSAFTQSNKAADEVCRNLRLSFPAMETVLAEQKEDAEIVIESPLERAKGQEREDGVNSPEEEAVCAVEDLEPAQEGAVPRPSMVETLFSPMFHLFKAAGEKEASSCRSSVDQAERPEQKVDAVDGAYLDALNTSCITVDDIPSDIPAKPDTALCRGSHPDDLLMIDMKPSVGHDHLSLVDMGGDCIEWDSFDGQSSGAEDKPFLNHTGDADVITSDAADLFFAVEHSKVLECNDEVSSEGEVVTEEDEEFEDIDPYLFIKRLPSLSEVVSPCRPLLLPRQTRQSPPITLVLDLDETLVHSTLEHCADADFSFPVHFDFQEHMVYVRRRPHLQMFMERVSQLFEIIVFTASQSVYAEQLLNVLDPKRKLIRHRIFRDSCVFVRGNYLKDLTILGRDLSKVAIVDNSPQAYGFQVDNGIPIESWFDDRSDCALTGLLPFLETLVGVDDVRPIIAKRFNLRQKIAAASELHFIPSKGDHLDRFS